MPLTLNDAATGLVYEIVYVTAISGAALTVLRGQEGTTAQNWNAGDYAACMHTALTTASINGNALQTFEVGAAVDGNGAVNLSQVTSIAPQTNKTSFQAAASQGYSSQSTFTAPSNGAILAFSTINTSSSLPTGCTNNVIVNGTTLATDEFVNAATNYGVAGCTKGTAYTVEAQLLTPSTGTFASGNTSITAGFVFIPLP